MMKKVDRFFIRFLVLLALMVNSWLFKSEAQSARKNVQLSDGWRFLMDVRNIGEKEKWYAENFDWSKASEVKVPGAWDLIEDGMWQYEGIGWYKTTIRPGDLLKGNRAEIVFNRVMYYSKVWLNGKYLGENIGGYLPFSFNITDLLRMDGENVLVIRVDNKPRIEWLPASGQVEWVQYGGILQPVELVSTSKTYIEDFTVKTVPDGGGAKINCAVNIVNGTMDQQDMEVSLEISGSAGNSTESSRLALKPGESRLVNIGLNLKKAELWSPDKPVLYNATVRLKKQGVLIDDRTNRIGIREVKAQGQSVLINGKPFIVKGVNRYDEYAPYGSNPPENVLREELSLMKKVGINTIRVHYPQSPWLLSLYDEYGFVMLEEVPLNWWGVKWFGEVKQTLDILPQAKEALTKMVKRDKNHPCVIVWSMGNECETTNEVGTTVMRELLKLAKTLDPTRLLTYVSNSDVAKNPAYEYADVVCVNMYHGSLQGKICNHIAEIDSLGYWPLKKELTRYRTYYPDKPMFLTEFGTQGVKNIHGDINHSEEFQAAYIERIWQAIRSVPGVSGGVMWSWADYYHRKYLITYAAYGPYGAVTVDRKPKKSLEALKRMYGAN
jgi:beta-galactosidase/beta-glucuronidase